jgi:hypothetical protein
MRVKLQLVISHDGDHEETVTDVITLNKKNKRIEHLGLSLAESKQLLGTLQRQVLQQQVNGVDNLTSSGFNFSMGLYSSHRSMRVFVVHPSHLMELP